MQRETSNDSFLDYGSVYHQPIDHEHPELIHQTMVANRGPSVKDVGIDSIGVLFGITFVRLFYWIALGGNTKKRKRRRRRYYY